MRRTVLTKKLCTLHDLQELHKTNIKNLIYTGIWAGVWLSGNLLVFINKAVFIGFVKCLTGRGQIHHFNM